MIKTLGVGSHAENPPGTTPFQALFHETVIGSLMGNIQKSVIKKIMILKKAVILNGGKNLSKDSSLTFRMTETLAHATALLHWLDPANAF